MHGEFRFTKMLVDRTWIREMGEDHTPHYRNVPVTMGMPVVSNRKANW